MVSRENQIIVGCGLLGLVGSYAAAWLQAPSLLVLAILLGVGVIAPLLINERLDIVEDAGDDPVAEHE